MTKQEKEKRHALQRGRLAAFLAGRRRETRESLALRIDGCWSDPDVGPDLTEESAEALAEAQDITFGQAWAALGGRKVD